MFASSSFFENSDESVYIAIGGIEDDSFSVADSNKKKRNNAFISKGAIEIDSSVLKNFDLSKLSGNSPLTDIIISKSFQKKAENLPEIFLAIINHPDKERAETAAQNFAKLFLQDDDSRITVKQKHRIAANLLTSSNDRMVHFFSPYLAQYMVESLTMYNYNGASHAQKTTITHNLLISISQIAPYLIQSMESKNSYTQSQAWAIFSKIYWMMANKNVISSNEFMNIISTGLTHEIFVIRVIALTLAKNIKDVAILPALLPLLNHQNDLTRLFVLYTLSDTYDKDKTAINAIVASYRNEKNKDNKILMRFILGDKLPKIGIEKFTRLSDETWGVLTIIGMVLFFITVFVGQAVDGVRNSPYFLGIFIFLTSTLCVFPMLYVVLYSAWAFLFKRRFLNKVTTQYKKDLIKIIKEKPFSENLF